MNNSQLGNLKRVFPISPIYLQRAAIIAILSFVFFLAMIVAFSIWKNVIYFLLATAFLIVQIFTLFGWFASRRKVFELYENGFKFKKQKILWNEIESVNLLAENRKKRGEIKTGAGEKIFVDETILNLEELFGFLQSKLVNQPQANR